VSVGLLIVAHRGIGQALLDTVSVMLGGKPPLRTAVLDIACDHDMETARGRARRLCEQLQQGDGVLVLTDIYGSTPGNIACSLRRPGEVEVVAGLNLPMLVKLFNYPELALDAQLEGAVEGARASIIHFKPNEE
jgi:PTS system mannose-specific IIA component